MTTTVYTDDELEALATRLEGGRVCSPAQNSCRNGYLMLEAAAMLRACKGRVRVKLLEWRDSYGVLRAETPFGDYKITGNVLHRLGNPAPQSVHENEEAAKAAAQADYEARILSALEPAPDHAGWDAAIEAAVDEIDCGCDGSCMYPHVCPKEDVESIRALKKGQAND